MPTIAQIQTNLLTATQNGNLTLLNSTIAQITAAQKSQIAPNVLAQSLNNAAFVSNASTSAALTKSLMTALGANTPAYAIVDAMRTFAEKKNFVALDYVTDFLTTAQKTEIGQVLKRDVGHALVDVAMHDNPGTSSDDATIANTVRDLMTKLGAQTETHAIVEAIQIFASNKNFGALDAVTDFLTPAQKTEIGQVFKRDVGHALVDVAMHDNPGTANDDAAIANAVRDLMAKLGAQTETYAVVEAIQIFASNKNFGALDAVTDYLTAAQKTEIGQVMKREVGRALVDVAMHDNPGTSSDDATIANTVRDLMAKLGAQTETYDIVEAIMVFASNKNFAALDAVTDYLTTAQKTQIGQVMKREVGRALVDVAMHDNPGTSSDDAAITNAVRNLMSKLGAQTETYDIVEAAMVFASNKNFAALDAVTDYLTTAQKTEIGQVMKQDIGRALVDVVMHDNPGSSSDDAVIANAIRDLIGKFKAQMDTYAIDESASILADNNNHGALDALLGELSGTQINSLSAQTKSAIAEAGYKLLTSGSDTNNGTALADTVFGGNGNDTLRGGNGNDNLYGNVGNDWLYGDAGNDILSGGAGNDVLVGGAGNDILRGGSGTNDLTGGTGADRFVFDATDLGSSVNRIADFNRSQGDKIDISDVLEIADPTTATLNQFVRLTANADGTHTLSVDANGLEGGGNFAALATIVGVGAGTTAEQLLTAGNLVV